MSAVHQSRAGRLSFLAVLVWLWAAALAQAHVKTASIAQTRLSETPLLSLRLERENPCWQGVSLEEAAHLTLESRIGIFCGGDPVNRFDPDGRCLRAGNAQLASFEDSFINGAVGLAQLAEYGAGYTLDRPDWQSQAQMMDQYKSPMQRLGNYTPGTLDAQIGETAALITSAYGMASQIPSLTSGVGSWWNSLWSEPNSTPTWQDFLPDAQENTLAVTGRQWYDYFASQYGAENIDWVSGSGRTITWPTELPVPTAHRMFRVPPAGRSGTFADELESVAGERPTDNVAHHVQFLQLNGVDNGAVNGAWVPDDLHSIGHAYTTPMINNVPYGVEFVIKPGP